MSATEAMTRGYTFIGLWKYIDTTYDAATRQKIVEQLSPNVRNMLGKYKDVEYYPASQWGEALRGIATVVSKDEEQARKELQAAGSFIANEATNSFLRLLMRVLTPTLFAKKIPSLWSRDNTAGRFEVDMSAADAGRFAFKLTDIEGYPYVAPCTMGWISFAMNAMGRKTKSMKLSGWSLAEPAPKEIVVELELSV